MYFCLKWILTLLGVLFVLDMTIYLIRKPKIKDNIKLSDMMGRLALEFGLYIITALIFSIFAFIKIGIIQGAIMLLFVLSPFIIGKIAAYKTRYLFTIIQFLCIILNIVYGFFGI